MKNQPVEIKINKFLAAAAMLLFFGSGIFVMAPFLLSSKFLKIPETNAQSNCPAPNVSGYAWSSNIGWVSMSGTASNGIYGVNFDSNTGILCGYAWSSNIGWIKFNVSSNFVPPQEPLYSARLNLADNIFEGWAKSQTAISNGGITDGGWDGWIKMSGMSGSGLPYGVKYDPQTKKMSGYAWGGDVAGWIDFSRVLVSGSNNNILPPISDLSAILTANPANTDALTLNIVTLAASVSGSATGPITYKFYCESTGTVQEAATFSNISETTKTTDITCNYSQGYHSPKVVVSRGDYTANASVIVNVGMVDIKKDGGSEGIIGSVDSIKFDSDIKKIVNGSQPGDIVVSGDIDSIIDNIVNNLVDIQEIQTIQEEQSGCQNLGLKISWNTAPALNKVVNFTGSVNPGVNVDKWVWMFKGNTVSPIGSYLNTAQVKFIGTGGASGKSAVVLGVEWQGKICYAIRTLFIGGRTEE